MLGIKRLFKRYTKILVTLACISILTGSIRPTLLEQIKLKGELSIVTLNTPTTYYEDRSGETGYEFELAKMFADSLGVELVIKTASSFSEISHLLETRQAHIAAAGLTITPDRSRWMSFSSPYMEVTQKVIYRRGGLRAKSVDDLQQGKLVVSARSSHATRLRELQLGQHPVLSWSEIADLDVVELLGLVAKGQIDFTVVDSNAFNILKGYYPNLLAGFDLTDEQPLAWALSHSRDKSLLRETRKFFKQVSNNGTLAHLGEKFYGHVHQLDYVGTKRFLRHKNSRLTQYGDMFQQAASEHNFDWRLLAAMSYQESHWNPEAKSYTGVRGLMMLTRNTAKELKVSDRLDPQQSIFGGAKYLSKLRKRLANDDVAEPDRSWMALAAYNVGYGHLRDARKLTEQMGGNRDLWVDVKEHLPLLSQKRYYKQTVHGYARGQEPVTYVQNIRRYYDILVWNDANDSKRNIAFNELDLSAANWETIPPLM